MKNFKTSLCAVLSSAVLLLQGCAGYSTVRDRVDTDHKDKAEVTAKAQASFAAPPPNPLVRYEKTAWIASKSVARDTSDPLPAAMDKVTMQFPGRQTIGSVAEIIQRTTGIKVMIHPDVMVTPQQLTPAQGRRTVGPTVQSATNLIPAPTPVNGQMPVTQAASVANYYLEVPVFYTGSLSEFLDQVATRLSVNWEYKNGTIEVRRFISRSFSILAIPGDNSFTSSIGKNGSSTAGNQSSGSGTQSSSSGTFNSDMKVSSQATINFWTSLEAAINSMLSPMGTISVNQGTGTVTVTDVKDIVDRVGNFIDDENRTMTRQVAFEVAVYTVRSNDGSDFGVNWNLVYSKLTNLMPDWKLSLATPTSLVGAGAGALGLNILSNPSNPNNWSGSEAVLSALAKVGKLSRVTTQRVQTINRKPAPVAIIDQTAYAASTMPGTSAVAGAVATVGITPGTVTTGFVMNLVPTITDRNSMILTFSLDISELINIVNFTSGTGASAQTIQLPQVSSTQFMQNVAMRSGETLVITGFEKLENSYQQKTLNRDGSPGLGGSFTGNGTKDSLVIIVTPIVKEGV